MKQNFRRYSDREREQFSLRRQSHSAAIDQPIDGRRPTAEDLYETILPQYADAINNDGVVDNDLTLQDAQRIGSVTWQVDPDHGSDQHSDDPDIVMRKLIFPGEFSSYEENPYATLDVTPRRKYSSVKDKVKKSIHQVKAVPFIDVNIVDRSYTD